MLYDLKICFTSSLKFLSSLYLSSASQLNVGYFIAGLNPTFCVLCAPATAMACIAALVASATACAIASLVFVCSCDIWCIYVPLLLMSAYMRLLLLTPCIVSCLSNDNNG